VVTDEEGLSGEAEILVEVATPPEGATAWTELTAEGGAALELPCGGRVRLNSSEAAPVLFFVYPGNPHPEDGLPPGQAGGFIYLGVGDPDLVAWPIYLEMNHNTGDAETGSLCLYHYASGWLQCGDTGERQGTVWARLSRDELQGSALTIGSPSPIAGATVRDLALSSHDAQPGEEVTASVEVVNTGGSDSVFTLTLEVDGEPRTLRTVHLAPGESKLINFTFSLDTPGLHTVGVGGAAVALTVSPAGLPDLTVSAPTSSQVTVGAPQTLPFNVSNVGCASSGRFNVSLYVGDLRVGTVTLGPLNPGEDAGSEFTWTPGSPGSYVVRVVVDEEDVVPEAFEDNNELVGAVEAKARLQEDSGEGLLVSGAVAAAAAALLLHRRPSQSSLLEASAGRPAATSRGSSTGASTATGSRAPHPTVNAVVTRPQRRLRSTRTSGADARL